MKLCIFTIVLDGEPWIENHLPVFQQLKCDWQWIVIHGAAMNNDSTSWCQPQEPRLSEDGTTEYLYSIHHTENVSMIHKRKWDSKDEMVNAALDYIDEPCVLMEIDSDELWTVDQLESITHAFTNCEELDAIQFYCRYYVGENLVLTGEHCYGNLDYEWWRAWRFKPGMKFISHEPPILEGLMRGRMPREESIEYYGEFDHKAYATEAQVRYKEQFYGYTGLLEGWKRLREVRKFPVMLRDYFPHVKDHAMVVRLNGLG